MYKVFICIKMTTEPQKLFFSMMTSLFQAQQTVADLFFNQRLENVIQNILDKHIQYALVQNSPEDTNQARWSYHEALKNTESLLEEIIYLRQGDLVSLAMAQEQVLRSILILLKNKPIAELKPSPTATEEIIQPVILESTVEAKPSREKEVNQSVSRQKILEFVRKVPERRAKEIIHEFSALSERTVKRGLKELSEGGLIVKKFENGAVYYSAV